MLFRSGTFVLWINLNGLNLPREHVHKLIQDELFLQVDLGEDYGPGGEGFIRMNIATPQEELEKVLRRVLNVIKKYRG